MATVGPGDSTADFDRLYWRWNLVHAAAVTLLVVGAEVEVLRSAALVTLALWSPLAMAVLYNLGHRLHPDGAGPALPNFLTSTRVAAAAALQVLLALARAFPAVMRFSRGPAGFVVCGVLLVAEATDFFDGRIARRMSTGRFGSAWDMETDSVFALALSMAVRHVHAAPFYVLLIGLMRYLYVLLARPRRALVSPPKAYTWYAKTVAAILVTSLVAGTLPVLPAVARTVGYLVILALQTSSFLWDLVLRLRPPKTGR